jgi:hypothetical protein
LDLLEWLSILYVDWGVRESTWGEGFFGAGVSDRNYRRSPFSFAQSRLFGRISKNSKSKSNGNPPFSIRLKRMGHPANDGLPLGDAG